MVSFGEKSQNIKGGKGRSYIITTVPARFISTLDTKHLPHILPSIQCKVANTNTSCFLFLELIGASVTLGRGKNNYQDNLMRHK